MDQEATKNIEFYDWPVEEGPIVSLPPDAADKIEKIRQLNREQCTLRHLGIETPEEKVHVSFFDPDLAFDDVVLKLENLSLKEADEDN